MQVEFYIKGENDLYEECNQAAIPSQGDGVVIDEQLFKVFTVVWNYDTRIVIVTLERIE